MANHRQLTFNEFQRELQKRNIPPNTAYMLTLLYERLIETEKLVEVSASMQVQFADMLKGFVDLREADVQKINQMQRKVMGDRSGVDVHSVANDPEDSNH